MSYKFSKGPQVIGDLKAKDDAQRDTIIDFGEDQIDLQTSGSTRVSVTNEGATVNGTLFVDAENASTNEGIRFRKSGEQYRQIVFESDNSNAVQIQLDNNEQLNIDQLNSAKEIRLRVIGGGGEMLTVGSTGVKVANSYTLPVSDGTADQVLQTNGNGQLSFVDVDPGPTVPQVLKVGLSSDLTIQGGGAYQTLPLNGVVFDTFSGNAGWNTGTYSFVATEAGYYDIQASLVFDAIQDNVIQYQIYLVSSSPSSTINSSGVPFIALNQYNPNPAEVDMRTFQLGTIAHFNTNQSVSIQVRQIGGTGNTTKVMAGLNISYITIRKL
jgi:hypothetical protein